jgi:hypothetical protein
MDGDEFGALALKFLPLLRACSRAEERAQAALANRRITHGEPRWQGRADERLSWFDRRVPPGPSNRRRAHGRLPAQARIFINSLAFSPHRMSLFAYAKTGIALRGSDVPLGLKVRQTAPDASFHGPFLSHGRPANLSTRGGRGPPLKYGLCHHQLLLAFAAGGEPNPGEGGSADPDRR